MRNGFQVLDDVEMSTLPEETFRISAGSGGEGADDDRNSDEFRESHDSDHGEKFTPDKYRILTLFLLLVVLMTFGGLIAAYVSLQATRAQEWQIFPLPYQVWVSTALILLGSVTYALFERNLLAGRDVTTRKWLVATCAIGAIFVSSQLLVWFQLIGDGFYMRGNPYAGFFYILTAVHAVHVLGGIIAIGSLIYRTWFRARSESEIEQRYAFAHVVGWYWHVMAALWVVLIFILGFWK